ncbi:hypothetical protein Tco_0300425, partial [Tanacetum coccineum]
VKTVNGEQQLQALVDGKKIVVTEASVRRDLQLDDDECTDCLPNATIFEELTRMRYEKLSQKLTFYKAFFSPQWKFLIHTILQCLSAKTIAWNEFSSTVASNLDNAVKFLMYPRRPKEKDTQEPQSSILIDPTNVVDEDTMTLKHDDDIIFNVSDLAGEEVFVAEQGVPDSKKDDVIEVNTTATTVSTASTIPVSAATITKDEITLAQALAELKSVKPKLTTATTATTKGILVDPNRIDLA